MNVSFCFIFESGQKGLDHPSPRRRAMKVVDVWMFGPSLVGWEVRGGGEDWGVRDWVEVRAEGWRVGGERSRSVEWDVGGGKSIKNLVWRGLQEA